MPPRPGLPRPPGPRADIPRTPSGRTTRGGPAPQSRTHLLSLPAPASRPSLESRSKVYPGFPARRTASAAQARSCSGPGRTAARRQFEQTLRTPIWIRGEFRRRSSRFPLSGADAARENALPALPMAPRDMPSFEHGSPRTLLHPPAAVTCATVATAECDRTSSPDQTAAPVE